MSPRVPAAGNRGATAVEVALLTPLLAMILLGVIEFGGLYAQQQELRGATREGARLVADPEIDRDTAVLQTLYNLTDADGVVVTVTPDVEFPCEGRAGETVTVRAERDNTIDLLFVGRAEKSISSESTFLCAP